MNELECGKIEETNYSQYIECDIMNDQIIFELGTLIIDLLINS